jgi:hypothetical protein
MRAERFQMCTFLGLPEGSDVYFMHVYVPRPGEGYKSFVIGIMSLVWPDGDERAAGIYLTHSFDGVQFSHPFPLHLCDQFERRGYDLPIQGAVNFGETTIQFQAHVNVPCRMSKKDRGRVEGVCMITKTVPTYVSGMWLPTSFAPYINDSDSVFKAMLQHHSTVSSEL